ncbi:transcription factor TGA2 isoform X1 [Beta vulgaris subsp. vulgaris]|uniref:transcription factor TGA2 isoform X1 n=1 Tax=Beta vulgaris subsp. vulgaris TaxID=3555 RepID=UPI00203711F8|nr:transcription factor TGA2 isoform X1 [Beta vulgaris subsp. vulgaris]
MQIYREEMYCHPNYIFRGDENSTHNTGELEHPVVFHQQYAVNLSRSGLCGLRSGNIAFPSSLPFGASNGNNYLAPASVAETVEAVAEKRGQLEYWGESGVAMADTSQHTDTSTDVDTDDRNQYHVIQNGAVVDSTDQSKGRTDDPKTLRRLAQNREAARKSRLRKKAYVQQLESSRLKLAQLEQELDRARQQGFMVTGAGSEPGHSLGTNGVVAFDVHYGHWLDKHQRLINDTRSALNSHASDDELRVLVESLMSNFDELFRIKGTAAKSDIFHLLSGMWKTPAERCFMWLGGFRSSELLKILVNHLEPLTEQQLMGICNLQQSSQQAEDALSQGMEALQQSLVDTLSANCLSPSNTGVVADYMGQMAIAMGKLATLENFVHQADLLRQQTLQQMHRILTTRQAARALLVIHDYTTRLRALSSLWLARPKNCDA